MFHSKKYKFWKNKAVKAFYEFGQKFNIYQAKYFLYRTRINFIPSKNPFLIERLIWDQSLRSKILRPTTFSYTFWGEVRRPNYNLAYKAENMWQGGIRPNCKLDIKVENTWQGGIRPNCELDIKAEILLGTNFIKFILGNWTFII